MREDSPEKLVDMGIPLATFRSTMAEHLTEVPVIYTGYRSYRGLCKDTVGFAVTPNGTEGLTGLATDGRPAAFEDVLPIQRSRLNSEPTWMN